MVSFKNIPNVQEVLRYNMSSFAVSWDENNVLISCFKHVLIFSKTPQQIYIFKSALLKPYRFESVNQISASDYVFVQMYNYDDIPKYDRTVVSVLNKKKGRLLQLKNLKLMELNFPTWFLNGRAFIKIDLLFQMCSPIA